MQSARHWKQRMLKCGNQYQRSPRSSYRNRCILLWWLQQGWGGTRGPTSWRKSALLTESNLSVQAAGCWILTRRHRFNPGWPQVRFVFVELVLEKILFPCETQPYSPDQAARRHVRFRKRNQPSPLNCMGEIEVNHRVLIQKWALSFVPQLKLVTRLGSAPESKSLVLPSSCPGRPATFHTDSRIAACSRRRGSSFRAAVAGVEIIFYWQIKTSFSIHSTWHICN